jgi:hypothetical protein
VANAGLGFYKGVRFHIDSRNHREWGTQGVHGGIGCVAVLAESGIVVRRVRRVLAPVIPPPEVAASSATAKAAPAPTSAEKPVTLAPAVAAPPPVSSEIVPPSPVQTPVVAPAADPLSPSPL